MLYTVLLSKVCMRSVRGVRDLIDSEALSYEMVVDIAKKLSKLYNYTPVLLPIFELSEVFHRTLGQTSDVVTKETYTFNDRDGSSLTLRPEFTASIARLIIENGMMQNRPIKLFTYGSLFRHERPQKGRYRQFNQINFEYLGQENIFADVEVISLAHDILADLKLLDDVTLEISSIGSVECRNAYKSKLIEYYSKYIDELSDDSRNRLQKNPLRVLDSKHENDKKISESAPLIFDYLGKEQLSKFEELQRQLTDLGIVYTVNPKIVRGLDYYNDTVFEFVTSKLGAQGTVLAGGRYDGLFEIMGAQSMPAVGFAGGIERLYELANLSSVAADNNLIALLPMGDAAFAKANIIAKKVRSMFVDNSSVEVVYHKNIGKQFNKADKLGAKFCIVFGENELSTNVVQLKNMKTGEQLECAIESLVNFIK